ncbi:AAA family ATPase [Megasphaera sp. ASD88]|uniref:ATP-binding protein n=1 Tax=Megasphaera sp. ASD88 TaxID=2027407 RepID=UPI000BAB9468|nr:ATP-binding protein [Megasphaera sp. ASD88]PAV37960.1 AAA family ATPase [Megasphaera sp. ASD88]
MGIGRRIEDTPKMNEIKENKQYFSDIAFYPVAPKYTFDDIILPDSTRERLLDVAEYATNMETVFELWGLKKTHKYSRRMGINLYGPPGTGKTMAAHAIAHYLHRKIINVNYADIESKYVGETPKNIRNVFRIAKESNSILFFDEADAILSRRVTNMTNATDVSVNQTRSVMLMLLNDYQDFIIFATNFIENFDPAFMRRIAMHIKFELPDYECRCKLWNHYIPDSMPNDIDILEISNSYENLSGSDISNAILMGAFKAARHHELLVKQKYVVDVIEDTLASKMANEKKQVIVTKRKVSEEYVQEQINNNKGRVKKSL